MFGFLSGYFNNDLAIDLGTANTLVYARGQGIILNEPTVIALNSRTQDVLAMGHDAWQMIGRTPGYIVAVRPLRGGAITDFEITQRLIRLLFQRAGVSRLNRSRVLICVPSAITEVERRAVLRGGDGGAEADAVGKGPNIAERAFRGEGPVLVLDRDVFLVPNCRHVRVRQKREPKV